MAKRRRPDARRNIETSLMRLHIDLKGPGAPSRREGMPVCLTRSQWEGQNHLQFTYLTTSHRTSALLLHYLCPLWTTGVSPRFHESRGSNALKTLRFLLTLALLAGIASLLCCQRGQAWHGEQKLIILGIDGMDPQLLKRFMQEEKMPNFARLAEQGSFRLLTSSIPPQSPVAWSNLITGMDAGGHGIFDFIHRDPKTLQP